MPGNVFTSASPTGNPGTLRNHFVCNRQIKKKTFKSKQNSKKLYPSPRGKEMFPFYPPVGPRSASPVVLWTKRHSYLSTVVLHHLRVVSPSHIVDDNDNYSTTRDESSIVNNSSHTFTSVRTHLRCVSMGTHGLGGVHHETCGWRGRNGPTSQCCLHGFFGDGHLIGRTVHSKDGRRGDGRPKPT